MKSDCPCKGCEERVAGCHAVCGRYGGWQEEHLADLKKKSAYDAEHKGVFSVYAEKFRNFKLLKIKAGRWKDK